ncbi:hypothetical protein NX059_011000 [Plenodomus lindquistii]|nr:hypothetical protein NX059_011000 [Plenodomus lindquistii]
MKRVRQQNTEKATINTGLYRDLADPPSYKASVGWDTDSVPLPYGFLRSADPSLISTSSNR